MRPLRHFPIGTAATAGAIAAVAALTGISPGTSLAAGAAAPPAQSAQTQYQAAIKAVGTQGVHFSSTARQSGTSITVHGDTGATSGTQTLVVKNGSLTEHLTALLVGPNGYINANATALHHVIGLTSAQSSKYAGTWLSFPTSNNGLAQLITGLLNSQVPRELEMTGPFTYGTATTVNGKSALAIRGSQATQTGNVPVVLYVAATGTPLPIREDTNPGSGGGASAIHGTVAFSSWGEKTSEQAPGHSVSLLKLVPGATSGATSTTGG